MSGPLSLPWNTGCSLTANLKIHLRRSQRYSQALLIGYGRRPENKLLFLVIQQEFNQAVLLRKKLIGISVHRP